MDNRLKTLGMVDKADENRMREITQEYLNFLDDSAEEKVYIEKIEELIREEENRLIVDINDVRRKIPERAMGLIKCFVEEVICFEQALKDAITRLDPEFSKDRDFRLGFEGSFGDRHVNPRTLKASFLGNMVCCEGIVTRSSLVRPKIVKSTHYCPATKKTLEKKYTDFTSYDAYPTGNAYPKEDENKNPLETEFGKCMYKDHQVFSIQELPEAAPPGHLPRNLDVIADDDLADRCKPGDRIRVIALFRVLPNKQAGMSTGNFRFFRVTTVGNFVLMKDVFSHNEIITILRSVLIANNILLLSKEMEPSFEPEDIKEMRKMSRHKNIFELLARSLAPSIYGHEEVKKAILCLLLGGCEKILENGTRLRGDINVLLIGDPSVAKSQMLRYVIHTAPRVIATTGRGSSGVGLTAAVVHDADTGERRLEAGAMVLADRGIVCIDEFDKMTDIDRTAIHEVMEQGRVSISKGGIHAKLNARCSVLAAANPVFGRYNLFKSPMENIGLQDSLLSRFDLIFVLLDEHDVEKDQTVAENVLKLHRYRAQGEPVGTVQIFGTAMEIRTTYDAEKGDSHGRMEVYEKNREWTAVEERQKILSTQFMRKYIHTARDVKPKLTDEASVFISERYAELRSTDFSKTDCERTMPFTARQLETMIRLSTAMAKARLSKTIGLEDAKNAYELLYFACFKEKPKERLEYEEKKKHQENGRGDGESDEDETMDDTTTGSNTTRTQRYAKRRAAVMEEATDTMDVTSTSQTAELISEQSMPKRAKLAETPAISVDRYKKFRSFLRKAFDEANVPANEPAQLVQIQNAVQEQAGNQLFSESELRAAFDQMSAENIIFMDQDQILLL